MLDVIGIQLGNAGSDFRPVKAAKGEELGTNFSVLIRIVKERVVKSNTVTDNFIVTQVVGVDCGQADTAVAYLAGEDLVTEDTTVKVGEVV